MRDIGSDLNMWLIGVMFLTMPHAGSSSTKRKQVSVVLGVVVMIFGLARLVFRVPIALPVNGWEEAAIGIGGIAFFGWALLRRATAVR